MEDVDGREVFGKADGYAFEVAGWRVIFFEEKFLESAVGEAVEEDGARR